MAKSRKRARRLTDAYAFPGFRPRTKVRGVFGDPKARIVTLVRRSKKQSAAFANWGSRDGTTGGRVTFAICRAATLVSTWSGKFGAWTAGAVAR